MKVKQAIEELQKLNPEAEIGAFNPVTGETFFLKGLVSDKEIEEWVEIEMEERSERN